MSAKPAAIVSIQLPRAGQNKDAYLRAASDSAAVEELRKLVTQMMRKPADFEIGVTHTAVHGFRKGKRAAPVKRADDERAIPEMPGVE